MEATRWWGYFWGYLVFNLGVSCKNSAFPNVHACFSHFTGRMSAPLRRSSARFWGYFLTGTKSGVIFAEQTDRLIAASCGGYIWGYFANEYRNAHRQGKDWSTDRYRSSQGQGPKKGIPAARWQGPVFACHSGWWEVMALEVSA